MKFFGFLSGVLFSALFATSAVATDLTDLTDEERRAFREEVRAYLLANPELLVEAINVLEQRQARDLALAEVRMLEDNSRAIYEDPASYVGGNPEGDIVMVEFLDYRCSFCRRAHDEVNELITSDGNIKIIVKEYPILGDESVLASRFAIATLQTEGPEAYKQVNDALMLMRTSVTQAALARLGRQFDLDVDKILEVMDTEEVSSVIEANYELGRRMQVTGTPTFIFGEQIVRGYVPLDGMRQMVEEIRTN